MRFERSENVMGSKLFSRSDINPRVDGMDAGAFLARLWALFGPPTPCDNGFEYAIRDRETGASFTAYSAQSGPSYGGADRGVRFVLAAFEKLLDATPPIDCEWAYEGDIEYGAGELVIGWRDGRSFERSRETRTPPETAKTIADCVAIAREYEGGYGAAAGWQHCLDRVLPSPPDEVDWKGFHYEECVGFALQKKQPVMLYIGAKGIPEGVPISAIPMELSAVARLWLDAYARSS